MRLHLAALTLAATGALTLSACGGSDSATVSSSSTTAAGVSASGGASITKADYIAQGDAICTTADTGTKALGDPPATSNPILVTELPALGAFLAKGEVFVDAETNAFVALPKPSADVTVVGDIDTKVLAVQADLKASVAAANAKDLATFDSAFTKLDSDGTAADAASTAYGFKVCGSDS